MRRTQTFSPTASLISSRSSGVKKVFLAKASSHFLFLAWSCKGKIASTFFHCPELGVIPAPPSSLVPVIMWWIWRCLSASVRGSLVSAAAASLTGCVCRMPWSQSLMRERWTTFDRTDSSAALMKTSREFSSPARTSVVKPTSARACTSCLNCLTEDVLSDECQ